ncbi:hypothetical protein SB861_03545 [Paraburkholderia sp. SIMBA_049]
MGTRNLPNLVDLHLDARLLDRVRRYAAECGLSCEEVLLKSVEAFLDGLPAADFEGGSPANARKRASRKAE